MLGTAQQNPGMLTSVDWWEVDCDNIDFVSEVGLPRSRRRVLEKQTEIFNTARRSAAELLGRPSTSELMSPLPLSAFVGTQPIL